MNKAKEAIRQAVADKVVDDAPTGTVIRWTLRGRGDHEYTYAAIKGSNGIWYTTSQYSTLVPGSMGFAALMEILSRPEVFEVAMATAWEVLDA